METCTKCGRLQRLENSYEAVRGRDGLAPWCVSLRGRPLASGGS